MAEKEQKKPDDILHIKLFKGESEKVDKILEFLKDGRPKKFTVIEALSEYIDRYKAMSSGSALQQPLTQQPADEGLSMLRAMK